MKRSSLVPLLLSLAVLAGCQKSPVSNSENESSPSSSSSLTPEGEKKRKEDVLSSLRSGFSLSGTTTTATTPYQGEETEEALDSSLVIFEDHYVFRQEDKDKNLLTNKNYFRKEDGYTYSSVLSKNNEVVDVPVKASSEDATGILFNEAYSCLRNPFFYYSVEDMAYSPDRQEISFSTAATKSSFNPSVILMMTFSGYYILAMDSLVLSLDKDCKPVSITGTEKSKGRDNQGNMVVHSFSYHFDSFGPSEVSVPKAYSSKAYKKEIEDAFAKLSANSYSIFYQKYLILDIPYPTPFCYSSTITVQPDMVYCDDVFQPNYIQDGKETVQFTYYPLADKIYEDDPEKVEPVDSLDSQIPHYDVSGDFFVEEVAGQEYSLEPGAASIVLERLCWNHDGEWKDAIESSVRIYLSEGSLAELSYDFFDKDTGKGTVTYSYFNGKNSSVHFSSADLIRRVTDPLKQTEFTPEEDEKYFLSVFGTRFHFSFVNSGSGNFYKELGEMYDADSN